MIDVASFWLNAPDLYFSDFETHGLLIGEDGEIDQLLPKWGQREAADCSWRAVVSGGHCSRS